MPLTAKDLVSPGLGTWQEDANCNDVDAEVFFSVDDDEQKQALEICKACTVREECLRWAIENREMYGIWGGMEESQRRSIIRDRRRQERDRRKRQEQRQQEAA